MANHRGPIPEFLTPDYIETLLQKSLKAPNLKVDDIDITAGSNVGDNYVCQIYRIKAEIDNGKKETISIIGKYNRPTALLDNMGDEYDLFHVETFFFDTLYPLLNDQVKKYTPVCYKTDLENSIFFMNDLREDGYSIQPREEVLNKEQALLVVEGLAVFHAATFHAVEKDPTLKKSCPHTIWRKDLPDPMRKMFRNAVRMVNRALDFYELPEKLSNVLRNCGKRIEEEWCGVCDFDEDSLNFLLHGDIWKSNLLFRYRDENLESVKFLDFQVLNFNSFANDLIYFLFSSVDSEVVSNNIDEFLELYYKTLLSAAPEIPNLSLERIKKEFTNRLYFGFLLLLDFRPVHYGDAPPDIDDVLSGKDIEIGFFTERCKRDYQILMPFFDRHRVFD